MKTVKLESWPVVLPDDDGIRPAGKPDRCFYCDEVVGQLHADDCCTVTSLVRFDVLIGGVRLGHYDRQMVYSRDQFAWEFQLNEGTWCADNALDEIVWDGGEAPEAVKTLAMDDDNCSGSCQLLDFRFDAVLDRGPFVEIREEVEV